MSTESFIFTYVTLLVLMIAIEIYLFSKDKIKYIRESCKGLESILSCCDISKLRDDQFLSEIANDIEGFYNRYSQERPDLRRFFPNVIIWLDAIIFRIDFKYKYAIKIEDNEKIIKRARDILEKEHPFNKCEKYQQDILKDIEKLENCDNKIIIQNLTQRTEQEFLRLSSDIKKNQRNNAISMMIGIVGIIISVLMAFVKF